MSKSAKPNRILIVDDDKAFLSLISGMLNSIREHSIVETARSGKECLQKVKRFAPNLVFLDVDMDGMNGLVTLRFIKSIETSTLVYFLSGHSVKFLQDAVRMVPADGYFTKTQFVDLLNSDQSLEMILSIGKSKQSKEK